MTAFAEQDFAAAAFARHQDGRIAARIALDHRCPWSRSHSTLNHSVATDADMARGNWTPIHACPDPTRHESVGVAAVEAECEYCDHIDYDCGAESVEEWVCTRKSGHDGPHVACDVDGDGHHAYGWEPRDEKPVSFMTPARTRALIQERDEALAHAERADDAEQLALDSARSWKLEAEKRGKRAEKAERGRDAAQERVEHLHTTIAMLEAAEPRPLTPDDVDGSMINRGLAEAQDWSSGRNLGSAALRSILTAALTTVPKRTVDATILEADLTAFLDTMEPATDAARADWLAARGWHKMGGDGHLPGCDGHDGPPCGVCASYWAGDSESVTEDDG